MMMDLESIIPTEVEYVVAEFKKVSGDDFDTILRLPFTTKDEAVEWKASFEKKSLATFRTRSVDPAFGKYVLFKARYHCQHHGVSNNKQSKKMGCNAAVCITIKKVVKYSRSQDKYMPKYPGEVVIHWCHNHPVKTASVLKHRDVLPEVREIFLELFQHGHGPASAMDVYRTAKEMELGESFLQASADRAYFPDIHYLRRLYANELKKHKTSNATSVALDAMQGIHKTNTDVKVETAWFVNQPAELDQVSSDSTLHFTLPDVNAEEEMVMLESVEAPRTRERIFFVTESDPAIDEARNSVQEVFNKLLTKLEEHPEMMVPSLLSFVSNFNKIETESGLVSALHSFGKQSGICAGCRSGISKRIGIQPTAVTNRKRRSFGKSLTVIDRPVKTSLVPEHQYCAMKEKL